jgi:hypothetical protein
LLPATILNWYGRLIPSLSYVTALAPIVLSLNMCLHSSAFGFPSNAFAYAVRAVDYDAESAVIASPYCSPFSMLVFPYYILIGISFPVHLYFVAS